MLATAARSLDYGRSVGSVGETVGMTDRRESDVFVQVLEGKVRAIGGSDGAVTFAD